MLLVLHNNLRPGTPANYKTYGGKSYSIFQRKVNRANAKKAELEKLFYDNNILKKSLFKVIHKDFPNVDDLEELLHTLRMKMIKTPDLMTTDERDQYFRAVIAIEDVRKATLKKEEFADLWTDNS